MKDILTAAALAVLLITSHSAYGAYTVPVKMPEQQAAAPDAAAAEITVAVSGAPAAGLQIYLCRETVKTKMARVRKTGGILAKSLGAYRALLNDLVFLAGRAESDAVLTASTGSGGTCTLKNVPPGSYLLYAGYQDSAAAGYWLLPLTVKGSEGLRVELTGRNMHERITKDR